MKRILPIVLALVLASPAFAPAGTTGVLNGFVRTKAGAPLAGAVIKAVAPSYSAWTRTDAHGFFVFLSLPPDVYNVSAEHSRYPPDMYGGTRISSDQTASLMFTMVDARCGISAWAPFTASRTSQQITSIDVRVLSDFPPPFPYLAVPAAPMGGGGRYTGCL